MVRKIKILVFIDAIGVMIRQKPLSQIRISLMILENKCLTIPMKGIIPQYLHMDKQVPENPTQSKV